MAKIDCIYNKSKTNLEYDRLARGQKLSVHQTVGPKSLCQKKKKKNETPDIYHCTCCCSSLTENVYVSQDRKRDEGKSTA